MAQQKLDVKQFRKLLEKSRVTKKGRVVIDEPFPEVDSPLVAGSVSNPNLINHIFIPGQVYSSKNSKRIGVKYVAKSKWKFQTKKGWVFALPFIMGSKKSIEYKKKTLHIYENKRADFLKMAKNKPYPYFIEFVFVRTDKSRWDWNNLTQAVQDQMVEAGWLPDDDVKYMLPVVPTPPQFPYYIDKGHEGVFIKILEFK